MATKLERGVDIGKNWGYGGIRRDVGHYVRSMIEANFCRILKLNNIRYEYECQSFVLSNSEFSIYIPDIKLLDDFNGWKANSFIEIKRRLHDEDQQKLDVFFQQYPYAIVNVLEQRSQTWKVLQSIAKPQLPLWETSAQNIRTMPSLYR